MSLAANSVTLMPVVVSTVTVQTATKPPSTVVAIITDTPLSKAIIVPLLETVHTFSLELLQRISLFEASSGKTVAVSCVVSPIFAKVNSLWSNVIPVTGCSIVTSHSSLISSFSAAVTVIVAVPAFWPIMIPYLLTVATSSSLEVHKTSLLSASVGVKETLSCFSSPTFNDRF